MKQSNQTKPNQTKSFKFIFIFLLGTYFNHNKYLIFLFLSFTTLTFLFFLFLISLLTPLSSCASLLSFPSLFSSSRLSFSLTSTFLPQSVLSLYHISLSFQITFFFLSLPLPLFLPLSTASSSPSTSFLHSTSHTFYVLYFTHKRKKEMKKELEMKSKLQRISHQVSSMTMIHLMLVASLSTNIGYYAELWIDDHHDAFLTPSNLLGK